MVFADRFGHYSEIGAVPSMVLRTEASNQDASERARCPTGFLEVPTSVPIHWQYLPLRPWQRCLGRISTDRLISCIFALRLVVIRVHNMILAIG